MVPRPATVPTLLLPRARALSLLLLLLVGGAALVAAKPFQSHVVSVDPSRGSLEGGTLVTIKGSGFARDGLEGSTDVFIGNSRCTVSEYNSNDQQLVCTTPPVVGTSLNLPLKVVLSAVDRFEFAQGGVTYRYESGRTPSVRRMDRAVAAGRPLSFDGYLRGRHGDDYDVHVGALRCDLVPDSDDVVAESSSRYSYLQCLTPNQPAGRYNVSLLVTADFGAGRGRIESYLHHVHDGVDVHHLEVVPIVDAISTQHSGSLGGQRITIHGAGFAASDSCGENTVSIWGSACIVESCTEDALVCRVGPAPASPPAFPYEGPRGVSLVKYSRFNFSDAEHHTQVAGFTGLGRDIGSNYYQRLSGYFVPPLTAEYTFMVRSDDQSYLYLSSDEHVDNETRVAYASGYKRDYEDSTTQTSDRIPLTAGERYHIRSFHSEGGGGDFFDAAVIVHAPSASPLDHTYQSVPEIQEISVSAENRREVQHVTFHGVTGGDFVISGSGGVSDVLDISADSNGKLFAAAVKATNGACASISSLGKTVGAGGAITYKMRFNCATFQAFPTIQVLNVGLRTSGQLRIQVTRVQTASTPVSGTFRVGFGGMFTEHLPYNTGESNIRDAIKAALAFNVTVRPRPGTGSAMDGRDFWITFVDRGDQPQLVLDASRLSGSQIAAGLSTKRDGSLDLFLSPIPSEFLEMAMTDLPSVIVRVNGIKAACADHRNASSDCGFAYDAALTPTVSTVSGDVAGAVSQGSQLVITGTGFAAGTEVAVGGAVCTVVAESATSLTCDLGHGPAGSFALDVVVPSAGRAQHGLASLEYTLGVDSARPLQGSVRGGNALHLNGTGFGPATVVEVGGRACAITAVAATFVVCTVPPMQDDFSAVTHTATGVTARPVTVNGGAAGGITYEYDWALTPVVTGLSPAAVSAGVSSPISLSGLFSAHDAAAPDCTPRVWVGGRPCLQPIIASTTISCVLQRGDPPALSAQPALEPSLKLCTPTGDAAVGHADPGVTLAVRLRLDSVTPAQGSLHGGTRLVLVGEGFSARLPIVSVELDLGDNRTVGCSVQNASTTEVVCITAAVPLNASEALPASLAGPATVKVNGHPALCAASGPTACDFDFGEQHTPVVTSITPSRASAGDTVVLAGLRLTGALSVRFDDTPATIVAHPGATSVSVLVPPLVGGHYAVVVSSDSLGRAAVGPDVALDSTVNITAISPAVGSVAGGTLVTITGHGFSSSPINNFVQVDGRRGLAVASSYSSIVLRTPNSGSSSSGVDPVAVTVVRTSAVYQMAQYAVAHCSAPPCSFRYDRPTSPELYVVTPATARLGDTIVITGVRLGEHLNATAVDIGGVDCPVNVSASTSARVECTLGLSPAGSHRVFVTTPAGTARNTRYVAVGFNVTSVSPATGTFGGGDRITITGHGFGEGAAGSIVHLCDRPCTIVTSAYDQIVCDTPQLSTPAAVGVYDHHELAPLSGAVSVSSNQNRLGFVLDDDLNSYYQSATSDRHGCHVTVDLGAASRGLLSRVRYFPRAKNEYRMTLGVFEVSADGATFQTVGTIATQPIPGWNDIVLDTPTAPVRYLRYRGPHDGYCMVTELQYVGVPVIDGPGCAVHVGMARPRPHFSIGFSIPRTPTTAMAAAGVARRDPNVTFTPATDATAFVTSVSPRWGTALGGTRVTITGARLPTDPDTASVLLNGEPCAVVSATAGTELVCLSGERERRRDPSIEVRAGAGRGLAVVVRGVAFRYLDRWSALSTWANEELPIEGDTVVIPGDQTVLMDVSPPRLFLLLVQGMLVFDDRDLALDATYIFVQGGVLEVGTEERPFLHRAVITLHGDRHKTIEIPQIGAKVLAVADRTFTTHDHGQGHVTSSFARGRLDIHGRPRRRTWVKLGVDAPAGSTALTLADPVDFEAGETIIVTSSSTSMMQTEELRVVARSADNLTLTVTPALRHRHRAQLYTAAGRTVDMRCEVALLSRNVVIQGDAGSAAQRFGAHTIAAHGGRYRVENTELRNCGQMGILGRYCTHLHMAGAQTDSYIKANSIHHSFQRATTIHGTHRARVMHNVAYDIHGHTFFVEDGVENHNVFDENLGVFTRKSFAMLKGDTKPATFWTANPRNFWRNNVAGGCVNDGFWFELPGHPHGPSFTKSVCPSHDHVGGFNNNSAHSNGVHGLRIYPVYLPMKDPCNSALGSSAEFFYNFTSYRNGQHGIFGKLNGDLHHVGANLVENNGDDLFWTKLENTAYHTDPAMAHLIDVLVVADTDPLRQRNKRGIFLPQQEKFFANGVTFVNYQDAGAIAGCAKCDSDTDMRQGGYTFRFQNLRFVNTQRRTKWTVPFKQIFLDLDGSLTGVANGTALPFYAFNAHPECARPAGPQYDAGHVCQPTVRVRRVQINGVQPRELDFVRLNVQSGAGLDSIGFRPKEFYGWALPMVTHKRYQMFFDSLVDFQYMQQRFSEPYYLDGDDSMVLRWNYTDYRYDFEVRYANDADEVVPPITALDQLEPATDGLGVSRIDREAREWAVVLSARGTGGFRPASLPRGPYHLGVAPLQCAPGACGLPGDAPLGPPVAWSDPASWPSGRLPVVGEDVLIPAGTHLVMNVNPPRLGQVTIEGKLQFSDSADRMLDCDTILVWGFLEVGTPARPFTHRATIRLNGVRSSPTVIASNSLFLGNKVLAVLGHLNLHGQTPAVAWTRLDITAEAGATSVELVEPVAWVAGQRIAITPTEYGAAQMEEATIAAVSADGTVLTLAAPLQHRHFAGVVDDGDGGVALRAAVGLLDRNVVFEGRLAGAGDRYGAHLYVSEVTFPRGTKVGNAHVSGTQFLHAGKHGLEHASVTFKYTTAFAPAEAPTAVIEGCTFTESFNYGLVSFGTTGLEVANNVFHRTFRTAVDVDSRSRAVRIERNLVVGNFRYTAETLEWVRPFAGFFIDTDDVAALAGNVVGGGEDAGFVLRAEACGGAEVALDNEAHAALVGAYLLSHGQDCLRLQRFVAWKMAHVAILSVDQTSNLEILDVTVADSHIGISLSFIRTNAGGLNRATVMGSTIMGSTAASTCAASLACRAMAKHDVSGQGCRSVLGPAFRRVGILTTQYTNRPKTCDRDGGLEVCRPPSTPERLCSMSWEKRYGLPSTIHGELRVTDTRFVHFNRSDCGLRSHAFALNPSQPDYTPPVYMSGIGWHGVPEDSRLWLAKVPTTTGDCRSSCDALNFAVVHDADGSLHATSVPGAVLLSAENPTLAGDATVCTPQADFGATSCHSMTLVPAALENIDRDRGFRRIGPVHIRRIGVTDNRTSFSVGPKDDGCAKRFHFGQFPMQLEPGREYDIYTTGSAPNNMRLHFLSSDPADAALLRIFYTAPMQVDVFNAGRRVSRSTSHPTLASGRGANALNPQERVLYLTMRGGATAEQRYTLRVTNKVQVNLTLALDLSTFFGDDIVDNLAALLEIPPDRIKFVSVHRVDTSTGLAVGPTELRRQRRADATPGVVEDVVAVYDILDPEGDAEVPDDDDFEAQMQRLDGVISRLEDVAGNGALLTSLAEEGIALEALQIQPPAGEGADAQAVSFAVNAAPSSSTGPDAGAIAGGVIGALLAVALLVGAVLLYRRHQESQRKFVRVDQTPPSSRQASMDSIRIQKEAAQQQHKAEDKVDAEAEVEQQPAEPSQRVSHPLSPVGAVVLADESASDSRVSSGSIISPLERKPSRVLPGASSGSSSTEEAEAAAAAEEAAARKEGYRSLRSRLPNISARIQALAAFQTGVARKSRATWDYIPGQAWYVPKATPEEAHGHLDSNPLGSFLVIGELEPVLVVKTPAGVQEFSVTRNNDGTFGLGLDEDVNHDDLSGLIAYYKCEQANIPFTLASDNPVYRPHRITKKIKQFDRVSVHSDDSRRASDAAARTDSTS